MTVFLEALDRVEARLGPDDATLGELFADQGIPLAEAEVLVTSIVRRMGSVGEGLGMALYLGILLGEEMGPHH